MLQVCLHVSSCIVYSLRNSEINDIGASESWQVLFEDFEPKQYIRATNELLKVVVELFIPLRKRKGKQHNDSQLSTQSGRRIYDQIF